MIDAHTHILPGIDDGSQTPAQSAEMLKALSRQGISVLAATPHFYSAYTSPEIFLEARQKAFEQVLTLPEAAGMDIRLGAEVLYFEGIQNTSELKELCISETSLLMLELPIGKWSERTVCGVGELCSRSDIKVVLAHVDRYFDMQDFSVFYRLADAGANMQLNYDALFSFRTRRRALKMMEYGMIQLLGSDCHTTADCRRDVNTVVEIIERKLGISALEKLKHDSEWFFNLGE